MKFFQWIMAGVFVLGVLAPSHGQSPYHGYRPKPYSPLHSWQQNYPPSPYPQAPPQTDSRRLWVYGTQGEGSFRRLDNGSWVESNYSGQYYYREIGRTPAFVDLFDANRNVFVRIADGIMYSHGLGNYHWNRGYTGQWE